MSFVTHNQSLCGCKNTCKLQHPFLLLAVKRITTTNKSQSVATTRNHAVYFYHAVRTVGMQFTSDAAPTDPGHGDDCVLVGSVAIIAGQRRRLVSDRALHRSINTLEQCRLAVLLVFPTDLVLLVLDITLAAGCVDELAPSANVRLPFLSISQTSLPFCGQHLYCRNLNLNLSLCSLSLDAGLFVTFVPTGLDWSQTV